MRRYWKETRILIMFSFLAGLFVIAGFKNGNRKIRDIKTVFVDNEQLFLDHHTVNKLLIQNNPNLKNNPKEDIALNRLEHALNSNQMVRYAQVYQGYDDQLSVRVKLKTPIARVFESNSYYIDTDGNAMPLSDRYTARVPIVSGTVSKENLSEAYRVALYIYNDPFLKENIIGIVQNGERFRLKLRNDDFDLIFGAVKDLELKFKKFKVMYYRGLKNKTLKKYKSLNLEFTNQVVAIKKIEKHGK